ncbi:MAG: hypothetical protein WD696_22080 [Bryobacteraceae bacterium]
MKQLPLIALLTASAVVFSGCANDRARSGQVTGPTYVSTPAPGVLPAGTRVEIRTNEEINTTTPGSGPYSATVATAIVDQATGRTLIPAGSPAQLVVLRVTEAGTVGSGELVLGLGSITAGGRTYAVTTPGVEVEGEQGLGINKRTGLFVGGGALLGTLVGAVAGGGTGAAIGAGVGALGGAVAQVLTRGSEIQVPAETLLTFELDRPLTLTEYEQ